MARSTLSDSGPRTSFLPYGFLRAERSERSDRTQAELGRLLAAAEGYRVLASDGTHVGWLDHVRYERHVR